MQRRLELAGALVHDPSLLFLDEPTAGIDPILRGRVWDEFHRLRDAGRTLLVTTQYVNEAESCDQVAMISEGRLIALAAPDDLRRQAMGGDVVEVETAERVDGMALTDLPFIRARPPGRSAQPDAHRRRRRHGHAGRRRRDHRSAVARSCSPASCRQSFDEVFAALVARDQAARAAAADGADRSVRTATRATVPIPTPMRCRPTEAAA